MGFSLDYDDLMDVVTGSGFLGTGGGGSVETGRDIVEDKLDGVEMVSVDEVEDDSRVVVGSGMGAPEALYERGWGDVTVCAFRALEDFVGDEFDYVLTPEIGASTTLGTMTVTSELGVPIVDGDGAGRAVPELQMSMYSLMNVPPCPASVADDRGNSVILNTDDSSKLEDLSRAVTRELGNHAGFVAYPMSGKRMKEVIIEGTISLSLEIGRLIRQSKFEGSNTVNKLTEEVNGFELITGEVVDKETETREGFDFGEIMIRGSGSHENDVLTVKFKNENMLALKNGEIVAMSPDRICWISKEGEPLTNVDISVGKEVACIGIKAPEEWRAEKGKKAFKEVHKSLGYKGEYIPIENM